MKKIKYVKTVTISSNYEICTRPQVQYNSNTPTKLLKKQTERKQNL